MQHISKLPNVETTIFSVMSGLATKHQAINLSQGFPDFDSDQKLIDLVIKAMNSSYNHYAPMLGNSNFVNTTFKRYRPARYALPDTYRLIVRRCIHG